MRTFTRSALTSILTTSLDFAVLAALVELGHVGSTLATFIGTVVGSSSNFAINRVWAFRTDGAAGPQAARYVASQLGSAILHTSGVWLLVRLDVRYLIAKVVVAVAAYLVWNYPMNRWFVFRYGQAPPDPTHVVNAATNAS
jgi:putative flippase GtrA